MAVKVVSESWDYFDWKIDKKKQVYTLKKDSYIILNLDVNGKKKYYQFTFKKGFKCDGLSVPKIFQWFLPNWNDKNMLYNLAGVVHDGLYGNKGFGIFSREDSDAIFRGLLRDSGINRFRASSADWILGIFACKHWRQ
ncbi:MAG: DUF1353 domain-containing protein [Methanobrevibacter sp.]|nr:DUF1353 domain-containing protein [Methanobrevibacter sp.]